MARINIHIADDYTGGRILAGWFDPAASEVFKEGTRWNGNNHIGVCSGGQVGYEILYRTRGGRWVLNRDFTSEFDGGDIYRFVSDDEARDWLTRSEINDEAIERYFGEVEEEKGPGRPEIGRLVGVRFPDDILAALDARAEVEGVKRAELIRRLVTEALQAV